MSGPDDCVKPNLETLRTVPEFLFWIPYVTIIIFINFLRRMVFDVRFVKSEIRKKDLK